VSKRRELDPMTERQFVDWQNRVTKEFLEGLDMAFVMLISERPDGRVVESHYMAEQHDEYDLAQMIVYRLTHSLVTKIKEGSTFELDTPWGKVTVERNSESVAGLYPLSSQD
jgi:hypothetical protein